MPQTNTGSAATPVYNGQQTEPWHGTFIWYELLTTDPDSAASFYGQVVGWKVTDSEHRDMNGARYLTLAAGEHGVGGVLNLTSEMCAGGARPGWLGYIGVVDTDSEAKAIAEAGGHVLMAPADIPGIGRFALVTDPGGAPFYLMTPLPRTEAPDRSDAMAPGVISWRELYSGNGEEGAFDFYSRRFGWETFVRMPMGEMGQYRIFGRDGLQMGGMMDKPAQVPAPHWNYYIYVNGIDAAADRVKANGGQILMEPHEVPGGSWILQALDPQGGAFALVSQAR